MSFLQSIFGGSSNKSKNESGNNAFPWIQSNFEPSSASAFNSGTSALQGMLGLGGGDPNAMQKYLNSAGYNFQLDSGSRAITGNMASKGLLNSGATLKAEQQYGQNLGSSYLNNYMGQLGDLSKLGLGGGSLISGAGQYSKGSGSGSSSPGIMGDIGAVMSVIPFLSDRRLKTNITKVGEATDGLGIYDWNWKVDPGGSKVRGVIADEVEKLRPWAFIPNFRGEYAGVNYGNLGSLA